VNPIYDGFNVDLSFDLGTALTPGDRFVQVTFQPLQILSRLAAVCVVALPLAALHMASDEFERQAIAGMSHQELIAFVKEAHANSFFGAYIAAAIMTLIIVAAVEAVAFVIRLVVSLFGAGKPSYAPAEESRELSLGADGKEGVGNW
jgi:hypothetical protein